MPIKHFERYRPPVARSLQPPEASSVSVVVSNDGNSSQHFRGCEMCNFKYQSVLGNLGFNSNDVPEGQEQNQIDSDVDYLFLNTTRLVLLTCSHQASA